MRRGQHKPLYSPEWERKRVQRWLEIVKVNPLDINLKSTQLRVREFQKRYERLEADVPTPISRGGAHSMENVATAHGACNSSKGAR